MSRAVLPVFPPGKAQGSTQHQSGKAPIRAVVAMPSSRGDLESQVQRLQRGINPTDATSRTLYAMRAYQSLASNEEKDKLSRLLGVDEYA